MNNGVRQQVAAAWEACEDKKAEDIAVLELEEGSGAFTDYFLICSGSNPRQIQAISDEVEQQLERAGLRPNSREGYQQAEWVLLDYVDFVVHVFQENARRFYDLERLWKSAKRITLSELRQKARAKRTASKRPAKKTASGRSRTASAKRSATGGSRSSTGAKRARSQASKAKKKK